MSLETEADAIADPFLRKALNLAVDGTDLQEMRKMMEIDIALGEQSAEAEAKVWEAAGGYAPTIGIIGAVLGLIQVMKHLEDIKEVGHGIAVAFVATVYGVGSANIFFLPAANKLRARMRQATLLQGDDPGGRDRDRGRAEPHADPHEDGCLRPAVPKAAEAEAKRQGGRGAPSAAAGRRRRQPAAAARRGRRRAMKRNKAAAHENHERWLVSYADFITLLFAFFVVMFASTQADKTKAKEVSESVREALEHGQFSTAISIVLGRGKHEAANRRRSAKRRSQGECSACPPPPASAGGASSRRPGASR